MLDFLEPVCQGRLYDCAVAAYLLNPLKSAYPCDELVREYTGELMPAREELLGKHTFAKAREEEEEKLVVYAGNLAAGDWKLQPILEAQLKETGMEQLFRQIEMPLVFTLHDMAPVSYTHLDVYKSQDLERDRQSGVSAGEAGAGEARYQLRGQACGAAEGVRL